MFITLNWYHEISKINNKEINVNIYSIRSFHRLPDDKRTRIFFMGDDEYIDVKQRPKKIHEMIWKIID